MSYNTRRTNFSGTPNNVGNIGQRRPVVTNNFVPGGQLTPQKPPAQQTPQQQQQQQQRTQQTPGINFRNQQQNQQNTPQKNVPVQQQAQQQQKPPQTPQQQQPVQQIKVQQQTPQPVKQESQNQPQQQLQNAPIGENNEGQAMETSTDEPQKKRPFWATRSPNKISKKERQRRRNLRLHKILQPKNAVMILNELVKNATYTVTDIPVQTDSNQYKATVLVEEIEHTGVGRSKIQAKNSAAEAALKYFVKHKQLPFMKKDPEGNDEQMEVTESEQEVPLPWQHVASFALFKLFSSWGEDPNLTRHQNAQIDHSDGKPQPENKPAKKMPENASLINPLMLLNQMLPHTQFEELGKSGNPPNVVFTYRCTINGEHFVGSGPNKKYAKKMAAFATCSKILGVIYPPDVYSPVN